MVEKGNKGRKCHAIHKYVKDNNKYLKKFDKNKESLYPKFWDEIICMDCQRHISELSLILLG